MNGAEFFPGGSGEPWEADRSDLGAGVAESWCLQKLIQNDNVVSCLERKIILLSVFIGRSGESKVPENLGCSGYGRRILLNVFSSGEGERAAG